MEDDMPEGSVHGKTFMLWLSVPLAAGFVIAAAIIADGFVKAKAPRKTICVKGLAERRVVSDIAVWQCTVMARDAALAEAFYGLERGEKAVLEYLLKRGVKKESVEISPVGTKVIYKKTNPASGEDHGTVDSYVLERSFGIKTSDVKMASSISSGITSLIKDGIEISSDNPRYYCSGIEKVKLELLEDAAANAFERAVRISGKKRNAPFSVIRAEQGVFQITSPDSTDTSDYGVYDTSSVEKCVKSVVTMEYLAGD